MIIEQFKIGNTKIVIHDTYIIRNQSEIEKILKDMAKIKLITKKNPY